MNSKEIVKLASGTGITFLAGIMGNGLNYAIGILIARLVDAEIVGVFFMLLVISNLLSAVARMGFSEALLRFIPPEVAHNRLSEAGGYARTIVVIVAISGLTAAAAGFSLIPLVDMTNLIDATVLKYLRLFIWALPLHVIFVVLAMTVQAYQRMFHVAVAREMMQPALLCLFVMFFVGVHGSYLGFFEGFLLSLFFPIVYLCFVLVKLAPAIVASGRISHVKSLFAFSLPIMAGDVLHYLYRWIDTFMIGAYLDLKDVGIYNAAMRTTLLISLIFIASNTIFASVASGFFHTGRTESLKKALHLSTRWCFMLAFPIAGTFIVAPDLILAIWGADFSQGAWTMIVLTVAQVISIPSSLIAYTLLMCKRQNTEVLNTVALIPVLCGLNALLIPRFGIEGAAYSLLATNVLGNVIRWTQLVRFFHFLPLDKSVIKPIGAFALTCAGAGIIRLILPDAWLHQEAVFGLIAILAAGFVLISVCFFALSLLAGLEPDDRTLLKSAAGKIGMRL